MSKNLKKPAVRILVLLSLFALVLVGAFVGRGVGPSAHASVALVNHFPGQYFAPYVDMTAYPTQSLTQDSNKSGVKDFSLAFVTNGGNCLGAWGGVVPLKSLSTYLPNLDNDIKSLRAAGGDVLISFGGEAGTELAQSCTSVKALQAQYQSFITHYQVSHIDFDIEGAAAADSASIDRRNQAIAALQKANPGLVVSYTLPVLPTGLVASGISLLQNAVKRGANVHVVNIMAMDYGSSFPPNKMGQNAINAATSLEKQLHALYPAKSTAQLWAMVGVTPMTGANDVSPEVFTLADAKQLLAFAQKQKISELSMWSINRDAPAFNYSKVFRAF